MSAFFSIIIPTYNRGQLIAETIGSVQAQTFADWECIVVDDGSTDDTKEVIGLLSKKDPRIKYVYQQNAERSAARNNGIRHSKGTYVCFLDSDDQYCENYLEDLNLFISDKKNPKALIITDFYQWDGHSAEAANTPPPQAPEAEWLMDHPVTPSRACVHKSIFDHFMFREDIVIVEDAVLWVSIVTRYPMYFVATPLVKYRIHEDNSVNRNTDAWVKRDEGLRLFFKDQLSNGISEHKKKELLAITKWRIAEYFALNGHHFKSIYKAIESIMMSVNSRHTKVKLYLIWQNIECMLQLRSSVSV